MATITTRSSKGSPLTNAEVDGNFTNLNTDKIELTDLSVTTGSASGGGSLSYSNSTGVYTFAPADVSSYITDLSSFTTTDLAEGSNLYYTDARARASVGASGDLSYNSGTGVFSVTTYKSADFDTDFAAKNTGDLSEGVNLYYTDERVDDRVNGLIVAGLGITTDYDDTAGTLTIDSDTIEELCKNGTGSTILKGTPVYQTGTSGNAMVIAPADASSASTMPAVGVLSQDLAAAAEGSLILMGRISGVNTSAFSEGDVIYVASGGGYTNVRPTGQSVLVQNLGRVTKVNALNGGGVVMGSGRANDVPNLTDGNVFIGNAGGTYDKRQLTSDDSSEGSTNLYYTDTRAQAAISVTDTGGDGSLSYSGGVITYTGPSASEVRAHFSGGTGVTITSGSIAIGQAVGTTDNVTFGNVSVSGDLTVNGTTTTVNSTTVTIDDPIFTLGGDTAPASDDNKDRGIEFRWHNGSAAKVGFFGYDDSVSAFTFMPDATNSSEVFSGAVGDVVFGSATVSGITLGATAITATGAEINYLDGVTSNVQTQLDAKQALNQKLTDISGLTHSDGNFIVSDGANFVLESGSTARTSLGVAIGSDVQAYNASLADIAGLTHADSSFIVSDGANFVLESSATARTSLGLSIGIDVQAYDAQLSDIAGLTPTDSGFIVGDGSNFVLETGATARASLGLVIGTDVQAYDANIVSDANLASFATAFTVPTSDGTSGQALVTDGSGNIAFAGVNATQLGGKAPAYYDDRTINALGSVSGTTDIDLADGTNVTATIAGATTFTISGITNGSVNTITMRLTNAGAYTITWPSGTTFNRNAAPTLPTTGDTIIVLETYDNATSFAGIQVWRSVE